MPKKTAETPETSDESTLAAAAKADGAVAGKVVQPAVSQKIPKLAKKSKARLPRKEKKAAKAKAAQKNAK